MNESKDFFSTYFDYCADTESPTIYHRWSAIAGIAAILGRKYFIQHGHRKIYPNFYTLLIGGPGTRKGSSISIIKDLLICAGYNTFSSTKTSKEKFLQDLSTGFTYGAEPEGLTDFLITDIEDRVPRESFICLDEFQDFIGASNVEFISLLTNLWDCLPFYDHRIKTGKSVYVHEPTINILSGSTPTGFATAFPPEIIGQGMLSRLLLIYSEGSGKRITWPPAPPQEIKDALVQQIKTIQSYYSGICPIDAEAKKMLDEIYQGWEDLDDSRLRNYSTRRFTHLLKLCIICSCAKLLPGITGEIVILSNSILSFAESRMPSALGEFGKSRHADVAGKILQFLEEAKGPVKIHAIWKQIHSDLSDIKELVTILGNLHSAEKVQKTAEGFLPKKIVRKKEMKYVDYSLLKEAN